MAGVLIRPGGRDTQRDARGRRATQQRRPPALSAALRPLVWGTLLQTQRSRCREQGWRALTSGRMWPRGCFQPPGSPPEAPACPSAPRLSAAPRSRSRSTRLAGEETDTQRRKDQASPLLGLGPEQGPPEPAVRPVLQASLQLLAGRCQAQPTSRSESPPWPARGSERTDRQDREPGAAPVPSPLPPPLARQAVSPGGTSHGPPRPPQDPASSLAPTPRGCSGTPHPRPPLSSRADAGLRGALPAAQTTWPYLKPAHYSKTIISPRDAQGTAACLFQAPHPLFPHCLHRPGQALNDSRCHCNFYQGLFLVKSLFVSERCDLAFFLPLLLFLG